MAAALRAVSAALALACALGGGGCAAVPPPEPTPLESAIFRAAAAHAGETVSLRGRFDRMTHGTVLQSPGDARGCVNLRFAALLDWQRAVDFDGEWVVARGVLVRSDTDGNGLGDCQAYELRVEALEAWRGP